MIGVTLREPRRMFFLYIGQKRVGKVVCRGNILQVWTTDCQDNNDFEFFRYCTTLKEAAGAILMQQGYGKPEGVTLERLKGIR